jgi:hypothetical protein
MGHGSTFPFGSLVSVKIKARRTSGKIAYSD